jgi:hypothetical protein
MNEILLWRKITRIISALASRLNIPMSQSLDLFYSTRTSQLLHQSGNILQCMSDAYIVDEILQEINGNSPTS